MKHAWLAAMLAVVGLAFLLPACQGDKSPQAGSKAKVAFKARYAPQTLTVTMQTDADSTATIDDQAMPGTKASTTMVMEMTYGKPDNDGKQEVAIKFTKIKQTVTEHEKDMSYDSEGPADKQDTHLAGAFKAMRDARITAVLDAKGNVVSVSGMDSKFDEIAKNDPAAAGEANALKQTMGDDVFKAMLEAQQRLLPDTPAGVKDKYNATMDLPLPLVGKLPVKYEGTISSIEAEKAGGDKVATIDLTGKGATDKPFTAQIGPARMDISKLTFEQSIQEKFNVDKGMSTQKDITQTTTMEMSMKAGDQSKAMKTTQKLKTTMKTEVKK